MLTTFLCALFLDIEIYGCQMIVNRVFSYFSNANFYDILMKSARKRCIDVNTGVRVSGGPYDNWRIKDGAQFRKKLEKFNQKRKIITGIGVLCVSITFASAIYAVTNIMQEDAPVTHEVEGQPIPLDNQSEIVILNENDGLYVEGTLPLEEEDSIVQYFNYYCDIYQIKTDVVYQKAKELTNDFSDSEWVFYNNIPGTKTLRKERNYDTQELGIIAFVRHMKQIPEDFGFTKEELATNQTYCLDVTYEEFTEKECALFEKVDPILCQAIQYHETGHYTSDVFFENNNPAGLIDKSTETYWQFRNPAEGILELLFQLEYNFCSQNQFAGLSIEEQIVQIQPSFCPLDDERDTLQLNQYWISSVTDIYHTLSSEKEISSNTK